MYLEESIPLLIETVKQAGKAILEVYDSDFNVELKEDFSPLTLADKKSHDIILTALKGTEFPVLSEEGKEIPYSERKEWTRFWLVDPLDGTKEFVKRNDEFTVNIAFIENGIPVLGIIYAPVPDLLYIGSEKSGAFKISGLKDLSYFEDWKGCAMLLPKQNTSSTFTVVGSRSHMNKETEDFITELEKKEGRLEIISKGSSLKLCLIAEGDAKVYPRFAPTMEWDIAAGHAIISASGGKVMKVETSDELTYNKADLRNPWFIAYSNQKTH